MLAIGKKYTVRSYETKQIIDRSALTADNFKRAFKVNMCNVFNTYSNFQTMTTNFIKGLDSAATSLVKMKNICISFSKRWFTSELSELRTPRNEAQRRANFMNDQIS